MSQTQIQPGHVEAVEKLTARLFFQPSGENGFVNLGNVKEYGHPQSRQLKTRFVADNGFRRVNNEQLDTVHDVWEFMLDEQGAYQNLLINLGGAGTPTTQAGQDAGDGGASLTNVILGRSYYLGAVGLNTVVVTDGMTTLVDGTDYTVDLDSGMLTILDTTEEVVNGDSLSVVFGNEARTLRNFTTLNTPLWRGTLRIEERNQHSKEPLKVTSGTATINVTTLPEQKGEFGQFTLRATFNDTPTVVKRDSLTTS